MAIVGLPDVRAGWDERDREAYTAQCAALPLLSIRDDTHLEAALARIDELIDTDELSAGAAEYLDALTDLVSVYEDKAVVIPHASGLEVLRHLMEERDVPQKDLVYIFKSKSIVSEVLNGKRPFTINHVALLGSFFRVPAGVFIDNPVRYRQVKPSC